jgi:hypothetical protein
MSTGPLKDVDLTVERLPHIGRAHQLSTTRDHHRVTVVIDSRGNRHITIDPADQAPGEGRDVTVLNETEASVLSLVLAGAYR